ncbi:Asp23/Gls24 family envelope stress response protein [Paenibacillus sp. FSL L8-0436]|uniref:Asp23/Gls24 family envelope stress response protein n=1 Tax=Paenibacillus sp. FSL L8-0436 TaxID=2954686 RepID=UPI00315905C7
MNNLNNGYRGNITISNRAILKIAGKAIQEAEEVKVLMEGKTKRKNRDDFYKAIDLQINGGELAVHIFPIFVLGTPLHQLAQLLQQKIKSSLEILTGLKVSQVNVTVVGIIPEQI